MRTYTRNRRARVRPPVAASSLRALRRARTLTQEQMAVLLDVNQGTVAKYEAGHVVPDLAKRERIAAILGTSAAALWPALQGE